MILDNICISSQNIYPSKSAQVTFSFKTKQNIFQKFKQSRQSGCSLLSLLSWLLKMWACYVHFNETPLFLENWWLHGLWCPVFLRGSRTILSLCNSLFLFSEISLTLTLYDNKTKPMRTFKLQINFILSTFAFHLLYVFFLWISLNVVVLINKIYVNTRWLSSSYLVALSSLDMRSFLLIYWILIFPICLFLEVVLFWRGRKWEKI